MYISDSILMSLVFEPMTSTYAPLRTEYSQQLTNLLTPTGALPFPPTWELMLTRIAAWWQSGPPGDNTTTLCANQADLAEKKGNDAFALVVNNVINSTPGFREFFST